MAALAYDSKRDSEVMKTITVVTVLFLPPTFASTVFSMGFFNFDFDKSNGRLEISEQGWIYLACTFPLTLVVAGLSFAWMLWTGTKEKRPDGYSTKEALADAADTLRLGAGPKKQSV